MKVELALLLTLTACTTTSDQTTRFAGSVTPTIPSPLCPTTHAYLQIRDTHVLFAPDDGTWILEGLNSPDGTITADKSRVTPNNQVYDTTFEGRQSANAITGTYRTPRCVSSVRLTRK